MAFMTAEPPPAGRWRVGLMDLILGVLAAGVALGTMVGSRGVWEGFPASVDRPVGVATAAMASVLILAMARQGVGRLRRWASRRGLKALAWPIVWRFLALATLWAVVAEEMYLLRLDESRVAIWYKTRDDWAVEPRLALLPIVAAMMMIGIVLASRPSTGPRRACRRPAIHLAMVPLAAIAGVLVVALACYVPYLIVVVLEVVEIAFIRAPKSWGRGSERLVLAGWWSLALGVVVTLGATVVAHDLRRGPVAMTWRRMAPRLGLLAAVVASGVAGLHLIAMVHRFLAEGIWTIAGRAEVAAIVAGFAAMAAGLAARSVAPETSSPCPSRAGRRARRVVAGVGLAAISIALLRALTIVQVSRLEYLTGLNLEGLAWLGDRAWDFVLGSPILGTAAIHLRIDVLVWLGVLLWLTYHVVAMLARPDVGTAPLDAIAGAEGGRAGFAWCTAMLTAVCLAALPIFCLGGLAVYHLVTNAGDLFGLKN